MKCEHCGAPVKTDDRFCTYCGTRLAYDTCQTQAAQPVVVNVYQQQSSERVVYVDRYVQKVSEKSRLVALLWCLFLGVIGAHKFYEGKYGMGVLYLLSGGVSGVGVVVDLLRYLFGTPRDKAGLPMKW